MFYIIIINVVNKVFNRPMQIYSINVKWQKKCRLVLTDSVKIMIFMEK